jgi:hypothetical protein
VSQHLGILRNDVCTPLYAVFVVVDDSALAGSVFSDIHIT